MHELVRFGKKILLLSYTMCFTLLRHFQCKYSEGAMHAINIVWHFNWHNIHFKNSISFDLTMLDIFDKSQLDLMSSD